MVIKSLPILHTQIDVFIQFRKFSEALRLCLRGIIPTVQVSWTTLFSSERWESRNCALCLFLELLLFFNKSFNWEAQCLFFHFLKSFYLLVVLNHFLRGKHWTLTYNALHYFVVFLVNSLSFLLLYWIIERLRWGLLIPQILLLNWTLVRLGEAHTRLPLEMSSSFSNRIWLFFFISNIFSNKNVNP